MKYHVQINKQASKKLKSLATNERHRLVEKIKCLGENPDDIRLDIKKMVGSASFRLRVGDWRVIFDRDDEIKIIVIEKLKARGDVYK